MQSIDKVQKLEADFFPLIAGELGSSIEAAHEYQQRFDNFMPEYEVIVVVVQIGRQLDEQSVCCHGNSELTLT